MKRWSYMNRTKCGGAVSDVINWAARSIIGLSPDCAVSTRLRAMSTYARPVGSWLLVLYPTFLHRMWARQTSVLVINISSHQLMPVFTRICPPALSSLSHHKGIQRNCLSNPQTVLTLILILCIHRSTDLDIIIPVWFARQYQFSSWNDLINTEILDQVGVNDSILLVLECWYHAILRSLQPGLTIHYLLTAAHNPGGVKMLKTLPGAGQSCSPGQSNVSILWCLLW